MERYCQQCIFTDRQKPFKEFANYEIMIHCNKLNHDVKCYGKKDCFSANKDWQHLNEN